MLGNRENCFIYGFVRVNSVSLTLCDFFQFLWKLQMQPNRTIQPILSEIWVDVGLQLKCICGGFVWVWGLAGFLCDMTSADISAKADFKCKVNKHLHSFAFGFVCFICRNVGGFVEIAHVTCRQIQWIPVVRLLLLFLSAFSPPTLCLWFHWLIPFIFYIRALCMRIFCSVTRHLRNLPLLYACVTKRVSFCFFFQDWIYGFGLAFGSGQCERTFG